ncbi:MAG: glycine--tRNA ligase subunit beta [Granulosicoccus sp.]
MADFLLELGCEELPAGSVVTLAQHLGHELGRHFHECGLCESQAEIYATPRRIAARFVDVHEKQADRIVERRGPAMSAAYKDGEPTKALLGFLRSAGVALDDVETVETPKGQWVQIRQKQPGKTLAEVLEQALPEIVKSMPMPRRMRWAGGSDEFLRPVVWLLALHGSAVVPVSLLGLRADNKTFGHRFHAPSAISLSTPDGYESALLEAFVMADPQKRRATIVSAVRQSATELGGTPVLDDELVDEVNALVEWPVALAGKFDEQYLQIPQEALIQTMQENQRYFALLDKKQRLLPAFITIANLESTNPAMVINGNERVSRPRFADTMFFWNQDKKTTLSSHQEALSRLLFQEKLGSVADKVERMSQLGTWMCTQLSIDAELVHRAVSLCKCDLNTEIVRELPKMQGICGRYYALRDAEPAVVAEAMEQHYFPKQAGGELPAGDVSQVVAMADRTDTLVGIFGVGMKPSGTRDPFGLRRASIGLCRIIVEQQRDIDLDELIDVAVDAYADRLSAVDTQDIVAYILERLRVYLVEQGSAPDAVDAVLAKSLTRPLDIASRVAAMQSFRTTDAASSLSAASKRIGNILKKTDTPLGEIDVDMFIEPAEVKLHEQLVLHRGSIDTHLRNGNYTQAMKETAALRDPVDRFFDEVMVMDENLPLRQNRLSLLNEVNQLCCATADLGLLRSEGASAAQPQSAT